MLTCFLIIVLFLVCSNTKEMVELGNKKSENSSALYKFYMCTITLILNIFGRPSKGTYLNNKLSNKSLFTDFQFRHDPIIEAKIKWLTLYFNVKYASELY